ncbi:hypothetical protein C414_000080172 [Campylobacter jejuni subsp. jejuni 414]|nr:hypothetical protein C414_000080172 [Campylobacter jejuni subsp. jejuni 414]HDZ4932327.1 helix-turn-helix transcriptional regulator [Campylobacter jejuni]HDZ5025747.1 helix-turn-helix transcriptional regulator [Campylobacter jejuni]HDZ5095007.1 helix-turn-helix transcriptional regulator [Campylobacter jejuni]HDZ5110571.1 helix-turn-helix transcriptional regulator [Campylobacter jejuni]
MKVVERINEILKAKNISKRELARRLIDLDMRTSKTGETPTESSIYAYLNGNIELKADMLPFIAEALDIDEQDFFNKHNIKTAHKEQYKKIIELLDYLSPKTLITLEELLNQNKKKSEELNELIKKML